MWPLSIPSALKPGIAAAQGPVLTGCGPTNTSAHRTLSQRSRAAAATAAAAAAVAAHPSSRFSLDLTSSLLATQRRSSLSAWPPTQLTSPPASTAPTLLLEPFDLPWNLNLPTTPEPEEPFTPTQPAPQQVTRHNFHLALPLLTQALQDCTYFALDCEFSGLSQHAPHFSELYDDAADRYHRVRSSAQQFVVMQLGLSFFTKDITTPATSPATYTSHTFNFSVFPKPCGTIDRRFMCQASSLDFLASQGFDFNRLIYDGIPYIQLYERDCQLQDQGLFGLGNQGPPRTTGPVMEDFETTGGFSQVLELIRSSGKPVVLHNGVADLVYCLQQFACPLPERWDDFKPLAQSWFPGGVYDTKVLAGQMTHQLQVPGLFGDLSLGQLHQTLGSSGAVEAILRGRNQGQAAPLEPEQQLLQLPRVRHAEGYALYPDADATTAASTAAHGVAAVEPSCLTRGSAPVPGRAPGRGAGGAAAAPAHEAGYDAFLTGTVFARLAAAAELAAPCASTPAPEPTSEDAEHQPSTPPPSPLSPQPSASTPASLRPWQGRLHSMRADLPFLNLAGPDPIPQRPNVFFLSNLDLRTKVSLVTSKFAEAGLGKVRVTMLGQPGDSSAGPGQKDVKSASGKSAGGASKCAFVQLLAAELSDQVLEAIKGMGVAWRAVSYAEYHDAKQQQQLQQLQAQLAATKPPPQRQQQQQQQRGQPACKPATQQQQQQQQQRYTLVKVGSKGSDVGEGEVRDQGEQGQGLAVRRSKAPGGRPQGQGGVVVRCGEAGKEGQGQGQAAAAAESGTARFITVVRRVTGLQAPLQQLLAPLTPSTPPRVGADRPKAEAVPSSPQPSLTPVLAACV